MWLHISWYFSGACRGSWGAGCDRKRKKGSFFFSPSTCRLTTLRASAFSMWVECVVLSNSGTLSRQKSYRPLPHCLV